MKKPSTPTVTTSSSSAASSTAVGRAPLKTARPRPPEACARRLIAASLSSSSSTSTSIEAPRGCLRYILPRSKTLTPKSAKHGRLPILDGCRRSTATKADAKVKASLEGSGKGSDGAEKKMGSEGDVEGVLTTPVMKNVEMDDDKENGCGDNAPDGKEKTPPVQASVSPEIPCGSDSAALGYLSGGGPVTPIGHPCYGAGHLLSGVVDKRKCRPRGILTVRNVASDSDSVVMSKVFGSTDCSDDGADNSRGVDRSGISAVPLPSEASMQWLLSPSDERENEKLRRCSSRLGSEGSVAPRSSSNLSKCSKSMSISPSTSGRDSFCWNLGLASPTGMTPIIRMVTSKEDEIPFTMDCSSDGNIILTPRSRSSSRTRSRRSWHEDRDEGKDAEVDLLMEVLHKETPPPKWSCLPWDLTSDLGNRGRVDLSKVQDLVDSKISWMSASTLENSSQSQLRVSWRDGLGSRMFELDEYDCCRFLSDDEEDSQVEFKPDQIHHPQTIPEENLVNVDKDDTNSGESKLLHERQETEHNGQKGKANSCLEKHCTAESMRFSGETLTASSDSDWNLCYKNQLLRS